MDNEPKKNYYLVYGAVAILYIVMIIVYALVVHNATENGAAENVVCADPATCDHPMNSAVEGIKKMFTEALGLAA